MITGKTGGLGGDWVKLDSPKPAPVQDVYRYWIEQPPRLSDRCLYWIQQIYRGWHPSRRIRKEGSDGAAEWYGVWLWEYENVIQPMLRNSKD